MPCRGSSIGMVKMYRKLIFWHIFIIKMTIETIVKMVNYSQIKQPWFLNERRIKHETINEQIWKNAQNYPANFINASKSILDFVHWNRYCTFPVEWYCESVDVLPGKTDIVQCL